MGSDVHCQSLIDTFYSPEIFDGDNTGICSVESFLSHMDGTVKCNDLASLEYCSMGVFRYRNTQAIVSLCRDVSTDRVELLLKSARLKRSSDVPAVLFQFWAPIKTKTGDTVLTTSEQPFAFGSMSSGLCRYKYHCSTLRKYEEEKHGQLGPPARVFKRRLREDCRNIMHYSTEEFPTRDFAMKCGIVSYFAVPFFDYARLQCVGVLECFSMKNYDGHLHPLTDMAEKWGLTFLQPHVHTCDYLRDMVAKRVRIKQVLKAVREVHQLPLIQVWFTCMCDATLISDKLFCDMGVCDENIKCLSEFESLRSKHRTLLLKSGEGLVGRAYSENRPCFFGDTSQLSLSDSPFAHLTRAAGLAACFVVPLQSVHSMLDDDVFLEMFLPTQGSGNTEIVLKSLLITLSKEFSKLYGSVGLKQDEEFQVTLIHSDIRKFDYFNVTVELSLDMDIDFFCRENWEDITDFCREGHIDISWEQDDEFRVASMAEDQITLEIPKPCSTAQNLQEDTTEEQVLVAAEEINLEALKPCTELSGITAIADDRITVDVLKPYFGSNIDAAANDLGVSRSTLKRRCRALGIKRWPWQKRNKVTHVQSNPAILQLPRTQKNATEKQASNSQIQTKNNAADKEASATGSVHSIGNGDIIHQKYDMICKATYSDDTVMFPLNSNSRFKELHMELNQKFQLQAEKFKIKYKYEDEWMLITCDEDLQFGIEMIKSTGKNTIILSILPYVL